MIDAGDPDVLARYVALLEGQVRPKANQSQPEPQDNTEDLAFARLAGFAGSVLKEVTEPYAGDAANRCGNPRL
jgi:hypothetical protein